MCRDGLPRTILKAKVESLSLPRTLTVIVTTAKKELKNGDPTSFMLSCWRKAFLSPFQQFRAKCRRAHPGSREPAMPVRVRWSPYPDLPEVGPRPSADSDA